MALLETLNPTLIVLGALVGILVGMTGVGSGSLLTPLLILLVGVRPLVAVGTDLAFAAVTKCVGALTHAKKGTADLKLTLWLACGSVPGALIGTYVIETSASVNQGATDQIVNHILGAALLLASTASLVRAVGITLPARWGDRPGPRVAVVLGFCVGILVGMTSIGAGSVLMAVFALLYRLRADTSVGTDVVHGSILAVVAATAHGLGGDLNLPMVANLLMGSVPGVLVGSLLVGRVPGQPLRVAVALALGLSGWRLVGA